MNGAGNERTFPGVWKPSAGGSNWGRKVKALAKYWSVRYFFKGIDLKTFTILASASLTALVCFSSTAASSDKCEAYTFASRTYADVLGIKNYLSDEGKIGSAQYCAVATLAIEAAARALEELRANTSCAGPVWLKLWAGRSGDFDKEMLAGDGC